MNQLSKAQVNERIHALKARVKAVKPLLPKDWRQRLVKLRPELAGDETKVNFLGNIIMMKTFDEAITQNLEKIAIDYCKELQTGLVKIGLLKQKNHGA